MAENYRTKAELEDDLSKAERKIKRLEKERDALKETGGVEGQDAPEFEPGRSEVLPGGGVSAGATLHLVLPYDRNENSLPTAPTQEADQDEVEAISAAAEGDEVAFDGPRSFKLADGGFASFTSAKVVHQTDGKAVVEVIR